MVSDISYSDFKPTTTSTPTKTKKIRCFVCNKKLKLVQQFTCKCNHYYCSEHKFPENHECTFDYKESGKKRLVRENPVVINEKLLKI